jgi:DNA polymerase-3 subunit gamma/tau
MDSLSQVYYRKWRPQTLSEVVGQNHITQTLLNALKQNRLSHAYLFCGPRGTGKTSTGRILAKAVNCLNNGNGEPCNACAICQAITEDRSLDVIEIDAASNNGVDDIRLLREKVNYAPSQARYKIYIVDECHMLSISASNALLKTLEEPPPAVIFVLATTEAHKVLPTILSRCQRFDFRRISQADMVKKLADISQQENLAIDPAGLELVAQGAAGSLRDAENILQQLVTYHGARVSLEQVQETLGLRRDHRTRSILKHLACGDLTAAIKTLHSAHRDGADLKQVHRELLESLRHILLIKTGAMESLAITPDDKQELKTLSDKMTLPQILKALRSFGQLDFALDSFATLPLEIALVDCVLEIKATASNERKGEARPEHLSAEPRTSHAARPAPPVLTHPVRSVVTRPIPVETAVPPPPESPVHLEPPAPGRELEQLKTQWRLILAQAPEETKRSPTLAILRSAGIKPIAFEGDTVVLAFKHPIHKDKIEVTENQLIAEKIISQYLGHSCHIRCIYEPEDNHLVKEAQKLGAKIISVEGT